MANQQEIIDDVMQAGIWRFGEYTLSSGKQANNIFDLPKLLHFNRLNAKFLSRMVGLIRTEQPEAIWGVPAGAQMFASVLGLREGIRVIRLRKEIDDVGNKSFDFETEADRELAQSTSRLVGLEDVATEFTQTVKALEVPELSEKTAAIIAGWRRGSVEDEHPVPVPVQSVIRQPVPIMIEPDHPFYVKYAHLAVNEPAAVSANRTP